MWFLKLTTTTTYYLLVWYCYLLKEASEPSTLGGVVLLAVTHLPIGRLDDWADLLEHLEDGDGDDGDDDDSSLSDLSFRCYLWWCFFYNGDEEDYDNVNSGDGDGDGDGDGET